MPVPDRFDVPGLMVDARPRWMSTSRRCKRFAFLEQAVLAGPYFDAARDLPMAALHAVAQADVRTPPTGCRPRCYCHWLE